MPCRRSIAAIPMNGSAAACGDRRAMTAAAAGPCKASSARSSSGVRVTESGRLAAMWAKSTSLRLALTTRNRRFASEARDHEVVDDAAGLVGQQRVALAAGLQAERCRRGPGAPARRRRPWPVQHRLAHVRDVEQSGVVAAVQMFGHDAAFAARGEVAGEVILHRHGIAGERHHPGAVAAMPGVERGRLQGRGGGVVWQSVLSHTASPRQGHPPAGCRRR